MLHNFFNGMAKMLRFKADQTLSFRIGGSFLYEFISVLTKCNNQFQQAAKTDRAGRNSDKSSCIGLPFKRTSVEVLIPSRKTLSRLSVSSFSKIVISTRFLNLIREFGNQHFPKLRMSLL